LVISVLRESFSPLKKFLNALVQWGEGRMSINMIMYFIVLGKGCYPRAEYLLTDKGRTATWLLRLHFGGVSGGATMTPELMYLAWSVALTVLLALIAVNGATLQVGIPKLAGNREDMPEYKGWVGRASRAHFNMLENLVLFAALVLIAHAAGVRNSMTLLGAELFFWGRVAHAVIYLAGIPWIRTAAWLTSMVGLLLIFLQLV
jgi:uncharacterized MAPEG superfamily protein